MTTEEGGDVTILKVGISDYPNPLRDGGRGDYDSCVEKKQDYESIVLSVPCSSIPNLNRHTIAKFGMNVMPVKCTHNSQPISYFSQ
jgi:hypothetical protein